MYYEAKEEHRTVDSLVLPDLKMTDPTTPEFAGRAKVVKELLEHHIEEEETEMFPQAKKLLGKAKLDQPDRKVRQAQLDRKVRQAQLGKVRQAQLGKAKQAQLDQQDLKVFKA